MQNLSGLRIAPVVHLAGLIAGKNAQRIFGKFRIQRESLVGGNDRIAPEDRRKPRNSRGDDMLIANRNAQRVKISHGVAQQVVEHRIGAGKTGGRGIELLERGAARLQLRVVLVERGAAFLVLHAGSHGNLQRGFPQRLQPKFPARRARFDFDRSGIHANHRLAQNIIPAAIAEDQSVAFHHRLVILPMFGARHPSHLEDIHEIRVAGDLYRELPPRQRLKFSKV